MNKSDAKPNGARKPLNHVVIVGGGTAGWMTAAALGRQLGQMPTRVTLIESDEIGAVGVGEATIPAIHSFNSMLGIQQADFMRACNGTFKLGIQFVDWGDLDTQYMHPFTNYGQDYRNLSFFQLWLKYAQTKRERGETFRPYDDFNLCTAAAREGRFSHPVAGAEGPVAPLRYAFHFDASLYARFLRGFAESHGVTRIEGKIVDVHLDGETGFVTSVQTQKGEVIEGDFFIDCSGFRGLVIEQAMKSGYEEWTHWLPCNRAIAVPCANVEPPVPYTRSTADEAGWRWRIPLQNRVGNGYVYSNEYISDDDAQAQLLRKLDGAPLAEPRRLGFVTGKRRQFWNKNCVALGLASGFLEPLESTSIHLIHSGILKMLAFFPDSEFSQTDIDAYNRHTSDEYDFIRDFIILHYKVTNREDTLFWRYVKTMSVPDTLASKIELFKARGRLLISNDDLFTNPSWESVMEGQGLIPRHYDPMVDSLGAEEMEAHMEKARLDLVRFAKSLPTHQDYIAQFCKAGPAT